jgi:hypothetical protein
MKCQRWLFAIGLLLAGLAHAQQQLEIINLRNRTAEQVMPQLRPFVEAGGALSGHGYQLFLRASPGNRQQIGEVLAALDTAPRRLLITVRQDGESSDGRRGGEEADGVASRSVRIERGPGAAPGAAGIEMRRGDDAARGRVYESRGSGSDRVSQQIQVVEGGRAMINVGHALPVPLRQVTLTPSGAMVSEGVAYRDIGTGFHAEPVLAGDRVTLTISPSHEMPGSYGAGGTNVQRLSTTISGRLGDWMEIGSVNQERSGDQAGTLRYSTRASARRVLLRVDELP